ncbi:putative RNA-binding Zn-ribbon protein involved in translation (DUF1610 family) [Amycolatopsis lexingtonensis]|uniref:RNA-binding Zn-ribbon protein involved in translation (DUF1610 family) n=1 Tax=Amycolatopsis lexingtonensis TaxID=218822 RepID=A0ABR9HXS2_9PSEU|nr:hypothetical protein [Amycolatopsis lexingtonensis]MBE1495726.1 putative RNA-binding Zn-ribbon protein involved in translation (DUF1610 family) [Amycolatopsis lexingtonensis]
MDTQPGSAPATTAEPTSLRRNRRDRLALRPADFVDPRYADVADQRLARSLTAEDRSEEDGLDPLDRVTCRTHRRWLHDCVASPLHVVVITGTRWCRSCERALNVAIDQLAGDVSVHCPSCGEPPSTRATRQLVRACRASLATAYDR